MTCTTKSWLSYQRPKNLGYYFVHGR